MFSSEATVIDALEHWAESTPDRKAFVFVDKSLAEAEALTFAELHHRALGIAARLLADGCTSGQALLLYPPGIEFIAAVFGCMYAGVIPVPGALPFGMTTERRMRRMAPMIEDLELSAVLTGSSARPAVEALVQAVPGLAATAVIESDEISAVSELPQALRPGLEDVALLQFTSGSTRHPKGVVLTHANLVANLLEYREGWSLTASDILSTWLPTFHDLGLVLGVLVPIYEGMTCVLQSPVDVVMNPARWLQTLTRYRASITMGPNFIYELCARKVSKDGDGELDLSHLRVAFNAAEPIRPETLESFHARFAAVGFRWDSFQMGYGLSEATCKVSSDRLLPPRMLVVDAGELSLGRVVSDAVEQPRRLVGSGSPGAYGEVAIVDPDSYAVVGDGRVGEIWVRGSTVARGYWRRPRDDAFGAVTASGEGGYLRTGDLGFLHDGHLFVTGRAKDVIIVNGENHYPQDIEYTAEQCHHGIRPGCVAAFGHEDNLDARLVVVAELGDEQPTPAVYPDLAARLKQAIWQQHGLPTHEVVFIPKQSIPKTSSGKIQRALTRTLLADGRFPILWRDQQRE